MRETATVCAWRGSWDAPQLCKPQSLYSSAPPFPRTLSSGVLALRRRVGKGRCCVLGVHQEAALVLWGS
jgi:hypothetical protein